MISTYAELKTAIADFVNRDDLTSIIPTFIALAEADIARKLRHWRMEVRSTATISGQFSEVPSDWMETIRFRLTTRNAPLRLISQADLIQRRYATEDATGTPQYYAHTGGQFEFFPTPDGNYDAELLYYGKPTALSDSNTSNWLLTQAPDVYLYGSLMHSAPYLQEDARTAVWAQLYAAALETLNRDGERASWSGTGLVMKVRNAR